MELEPTLFLSNFWRVAMIGVRCTSFLVLFCFWSNLLASCYNWNSLHELLFLSDAIRCTWFKLGGWVEFGPTFFFEYFFGELI